MSFCWVVCTISIVVSNLSCLALFRWLELLWQLHFVNIFIVLFSFFFSILPTKRNLFTYLNAVLVLDITALVNVKVGGVIIADLKNSQILACDKSTLVVF